VDGPVGEPDGAELDEPDGAGVGVPDEAHAEICASRNVVFSVTSASTVFCAASIAAWPVSRLF
jgi:hypothetical protein